MPLFLLDKYAIWDIETEEYIKHLTHEYEDLILEPKTHKTLLGMTVYLQTCMLWE